MILILILLAATFLCYFCAVVVLAWVGTNHAPREEMFTCQKHGLFPAKYSLRLNTLGITHDDSMTMCPMCMEDRFREARKNAGLK